MASSVIDVIAGCVTAVRRLAEFVRVAVNFEYAGFAGSAGSAGSAGFAEFTGRSAESVNLRKFWGFDSKEEYKRLLLSLLISMSKPVESRLVAMDAY